MALANLPNVDGLTSLSELKNAVGKMTKELSWLLQNLDTRNVNELNAEVIVAGSITTGKLAADSVVAENISAGSVETDKLAAGAVTAEKITVTELSAIAADLGHITAGLIESIEIYGAYISTKNGTYPRTEMSSTGNIFAARSSADHYIAIDPDYAGTPALKWVFAGAERGGLNDIAGVMELLGIGGMLLNVSGGNLDMNVTGDVNINPTNYAKLASWSKLLNVSSGRTLGQDISEIFDRLEAGGL